MDLRAKTCCFTGHRSLSGAEKLKAAVRLRRVIEEQIKAGILFRLRWHRWAAWWVGPT